MSAQTEGVTLSESEIQDIVEQIERAKERAVSPQVPHDCRFANLNGALSVILWRIDPRIGDAVILE